MRWIYFLGITISICLQLIKAQELPPLSEREQNKSPPPIIVQQKDLLKANPKIQQTILSKDIELISKEIQLTEDALSIYEKKLEILQKIYEVYKESDNQLLYSSDEFLENYLGKEKVFKMIYNQFVNRLQTYESKKSSTELQQLNQKQLANKITKKSSFNITQSIKEVQFLNTFSYRSLQGSTLSYMVAAQLYNHTLFFFDLYGQQLIDPYIPGHRIHLLALAPKVDEVIIATLGTDNSIRIGRLENKKVRMNATETTSSGNVEEDDDFIFKKYIGNSETPHEDQKNQKSQQTRQTNQTASAQYRSRSNQQMALNNTLSSQTNSTSNRTQIVSKNVTTQASQVSNASGYRSRSQKTRKPERYKYVIQKEKSIKLIDYTNSTTPQESIYSSILQLTVKGTRLFLLGDKLGHIHTYHRNGTYKGKVKVSNDPIIQLIKTYPNTIFATKSQIGQFNPLTQEVTPPICDQITDGIKEIQPDALYNSHFYILTQKNEVIVIEMKNSDNSCRFKQKLNQLTIKGTDDQEFYYAHESNLITIKNNLMVWNSQNNQLKVYNTTDIQQEQTELYEPFDLEVHKQSEENSVLAYKFQKLTSTSSYILVHEKSSLLSNVTIYEVVIPQKQETDFINNIRVPILIIAVVVFILYQYFKKDQDDSKSSFEDFNLKSDKQNLEDEKKGETQSKQLKSIDNGPSTSETQNRSTSSSGNNNSGITNKYEHLNLKSAMKQQQQQQSSQTTQQQSQKRNYVSRMHDIDDIDYRKHLHY